MTEGRTHNEKAEDLIVLLDMYAKLVAAHEINPLEFKEEILNWSGCAEKSPLYYMAIGFQGALELIDYRNASVSRRCEKYFDQC